jgi:hypothetical protein
MDYRHISVTVVDNVIIVRFKNLWRVHDDCEMIMEIEKELGSLAEDAQECSLIVDFEHKAFFPVADFVIQLWKLHQIMIQSNRTLKLCNLAPSVNNYFQANKVSDFLSLHDSLDDALVASIDQKPSHSDVSEEDV